MGDYIMKKINFTILLFIFVLILTSCGNIKKKQKTDEGPGIVVDKGITTISITVPAIFFIDEDEDDIRVAAEEKGFQSCKVNSDGSITYTMTKSKHKELLSEFRTDIEETVKEMVSGDDEKKIGSFLDIKYNKDFSQFDVYVDRDKYTLWDSMYVLTFYVQGAYYQIFNGIPGDKIDVIVNFIDSATGENIESGSYKTWIEDSKEADSVNNYNEDLKLDE